VQQRLHRHLGCTGHAGGRPELEVEQGFVEKEVEQELVD